MSKGVGQRGGVAVDEPALAVQVVHREDAVVGEVIAIRLGRLLREEVTLQTNGRCTLYEGERVGQREKDEVPVLVGSLEVGAAVVDVRVDTWIVVRTVGMVLLGEIEQAVIDLDRVYMLCTVLQRHRDVVTATGSDHEEIVHRSIGCQVLVHRLVDRPVGGACLEPVRYTVDENLSAVVVHAVVGLVIRGPQNVVFSRLDAEGSEKNQEWNADECGVADPLRPDGPHQDRRSDERPHDGRCADERQGREADDAEERTDEVELVGVEVLQLTERDGNAVADTGQHQGHGKEDRRKCEFAGWARRLQFGTEEDEIATGRFHRDGHVVHEDDESTECQGCELQQFDAAAVGPQEPETDTEEAAQQHDVGEVGEVEDVAPEPANESQLDEQHQEAERNQADAQLTGRSHGDEGT